MTLNYSSLCCATFFLGVGEASSSFLPLFLDVFSSSLLLFLSDLEFSRLTFPLVLMGFSRGDLTDLSAFGCSFSLVSSESGDAFLGSSCCVSSVTFVGLSESLTTFFFLGRFFFRAGIVVVGIVLIVNVVVIVISLIFGIIFCFFIIFFLFLFLFSAG